MAACGSPINIDLGAFEDEKEEMKAKARLRLPHIDMEEFTKWSHELKREDIADITTKQFVSEVIIPMCKEKMCRIDDLVPSLAHYQKDAKFYAFISHAWGLPLINIIDREITNYPCFFDICSINQINPGSDLGRIKHEIENAHRLIVLIDPKGVVFTRVWCLFEIVTAICSNVEVSFKAVGIDFDKPRLELFTDLVALFSDVVKFLDVAKAEASFQSDKEKILSFVEEEVGLVKTNKLIIASLEEQIAHWRKLIEEETE